MTTGTSPRPATPACSPRTSPRLPALAGALALCLAAACVDRTATGPELLPPPDGDGSSAALACRADVRQGTLQCASPAPAGAGGGSATILGGQGINVRLRSSGPSYDGADTFRVNVTVENLTGQTLGTADGATPAPEGVRVFFSGGPISSSGAVEVINATGEAFFTAAGQKYFQYEGLLAPGDTSEALEWRFSVPPTVAAFQFWVYVAAPVPHEEGWLRLSPFLPSLAVGESMPLTAQGYDVAGRPVTTGPVTWSSADSTIARVAADGTITAVATGSTRVYATDGDRTSSVLVRVYAAGADVTPPTAHEFAVAEQRVQADGADSVTLSARMTDAGTGIYWLQASLVSPLGAHGTYCIAWDPAQGTRADGTFTCRAPIPLGAEDGLWTMRFVWVRDQAGNDRTTGPVGLRDAGVPAQVYVHSPNADVQAPTVANVTFTPDSLAANGVDSTTVELQVADAGTGVASAGVWFRGPDGTFWSCEATAPSEGTPADGTFRCRFGFPFDGELAGDWTLDLVRVSDVTGNVRELGPAALDSAGYRRILRVTSPPPDTTAPSLTDFSFSPDTIVANGVDSVTVTMELTDAGAGALRAEVHFINTSPSPQITGCAAYGMNVPHPGSEVITCRFAIPAGGRTGEWRVYFVGMEDNQGNTGVVRGVDLEAQGYPVVLTVTP
ncbi:MAG TPA: Ig-like domain-containing protein [Longimicrobium sp.]|nr:Ig-like domain-containing protein [Longimicrobium sp.]